MPKRLPIRVLWGCLLCPAKGESFGFQASDSEAFQKHLTEEHQLGWDSVGRLELIRFERRDTYVFNGLPIACSVAIGEEAAATDASAKKLQQMVKPT